MLEGPQDWLTLEEAEKEARAEGNTVVVGSHVLRVVPEVDRNGKFLENMPGGESNEHRQVLQASGS